MSEVLRGRLVLPTGIVEDGVVELDRGRLVAVRCANADDPRGEADLVVLPGLVDLHCHGGGGGSFASGEPEQIIVAARSHLARGTTRLVGSTVSDAPERMLKAVAALADAVEEGELVGIHVEGPFVSSSHCGAQDPRHIRTPDPVLAGELLAAGRGHVSTMTIAAELPGALDLAELVGAAGVAVALGHTAVSAEDARRFLVRSEVGLVTHLFNAMPPVHHRAPGPALAALAAAAVGSVAVELVADGAHLADETVRAALAIAPDSVVLVTDAMAAAGMADGRYRLGPQEVDVVDGTARLAEGGAIAGGTSFLLDQVRRHHRAGLDLAGLVRAAAERPARLLGAVDRYGALRVGLSADAVVLDRELRLRRVFRDGAWVV